MKYFHWLWGAGTVTRETKENPGKCIGRLGFLLQETTLIPLKFDPTNSSPNKAMAYTKMIIKQQAV
jgi:hypothetical protein